MGWNGASLQMLLLCFLLESVCNSGNADSIILFQSWRLFKHNIVELLVITNELLVIILHWLIVMSSAVAIYLNLLNLLGGDGSLTLFCPLDKLFLIPKHVNHYNTLACLPRVLISPSLSFFISYLMPDQIDLISFIIHVSKLYFSH